MNGVGIIGVGAYVPHQVVTNTDLEQKIDTTDEWIRMRTGISERRIADEKTDTAKMATIAAQRALQHAQINGADIDLIIVATATPDYAFPSVACLVQKALQIPQVPAMDVSAACSGFVYALITAKQFIKAKTYKRILVIGSEKFSKIIDWTDRTTSILFGDGAAAVVLGEVSPGRGILSYELGANGKGAHHLFVDKDTNVVKMNGREVFKFAVRQMPESSLSVVKKAGLTKEDVHFLIPHQANIRIIDAARERLGLTKDKVSTTITKHGNTSAASIPLALWTEIENGNISDDDIVVIVGFGSGLTWGSVCLRWGK